jgi:rhamnose utilization protein RhaD (predicted bifunctional aldolase and dehydrogenase)
MPETTVLDQLVALSNALGRPELDYAILGEGNTSARADDATGGSASFWVKTSGTELRTITAAGFVRVAFDRALALVNRPNLTDADVKAGLTAAARAVPATAGDQLHRSHARHRGQHAHLLRRVRAGLRGPALPR